MRSRRLIALLVAACTVVVAGCGSSSSSSPVATEVSYLPASSPLVVSIATDPNGSAIHGVSALLGQFPFASLGIGALKQKLQQNGVNYDGDVKPLFGNPVFIALAGIGVPSTSTLTHPASTNALIVWKTKDKDKLKSLLQRAAPGLHRSGHHDGAAIYNDGTSGAFAIDGSTLVFGASAAAVNAALDRHKKGRGMTEAQYKTATATLPSDALVSAVGDIGSLLTSQGMASARQVPWVGAIHSYAESITASASGIKVSYHIDTSGAQLSDAQLPFAPGNTAPALAGNFPITLGIHDPAHIFQFAESAEQVASPASYAAFQKRQAAVRAKTGVDLNSLFSLLTGDLIIASDTHNTMGRVTVSDPTAAADVLNKLSSLRGVFKTNSLRRVARGWRYITGTSALPMLLVGNQLVVGKGTVAQLKAFATAPTTPAAGAQGAIAFRVSLTELISLALHSSASTSQVARSVLSQLTDLTGSTSVSSSGVTGDSTLGVR
jgi:hypothetical protein